MGKYNFNSIIDRSHSDAIKYCELNKWFDSDNLLPMWIADMDFTVCPEITEALQRRISHRIYGYASVPDEFFPTIAEWLKRRHDFSTSPEEMTYIPGIVKGIGFVINRFCKPGDKIVIQPPVYHPFRRLVESNDCIVVNNPLIRRDDRYEMDLDGLEDIVRREHPRMMILCNPHNPIGIQWSRETLARVADICAAAGVIVVSDEIHGDLMLDGKPHIPYLSVSDNARRTGIMLGAPSKTFNVPGLVSSWCVIKDKEMRHTFFSWLENNEFNAPTCFATIGTIAAYHYGEEWLTEALEYISDNINHVSRAIERISRGRIRVYRPQASFLIWLDCRGLGMSHDELKEFFVKEAKLALNDGAMFGTEGEGFMRMNVATPRSVIDDSLRRIASALERHPLGDGE
ncbi:MAG: pyridoxal phosphate-dependent aminotransferase [Muribaculaceae bacterium]|nr:pyridoxal phosphate-dependent aminotransferase [Muribaculaceae bacterium]